LVIDPTHRDDLDALDGEVPTAALSHGMQRHPVAVPLDQHNAAQASHPTIRSAARPPVNRISGQYFTFVRTRRSDALPIGPGRGKSGCQNSRGPA
jgi:hypothetical protein